MCCFLSITIIALQQSLCLSKKTPTNIPPNIKCPVWGHDAVAQAEKTLPPYTQMYLMPECLHYPLHLICTRCPLPTRSTTYNMLPTPHCPIWGQQSRELTLRCFSTWAPALCIIFLSMCARLLICTCVYGLWLHLIMCAMQNYMLCVYNSSLRLRVYHYNYI